MPVSKEQQVELIESLLQDAEALEQDYRALQAERAENRNLLRGVARRGATAEQQKRIAAVYPPRKPRGGGEAE